MRSERYTDKIAAHEDWKDGMNAFRNKMCREITEIYQELARIKKLTLKLVEYIELKADDVDSDLEARTVGAEDEAM